MFEKFIKMVVIILGALLNAVALNFFLIPANVYASGFTGIAQLLTNFLPLSTGILLALLNIPVVILAWVRVGRFFTIFSIISIFLLSLFLEVIPVEAISGNVLLNAVFGGVIGAIGTGLTLKYGASTGGLDIIAMVLSRISNQSVGNYFFILNGLIVSVTGVLFGWELALYTLVTLYVSSRVIDAIHTSNVKLTAMIMTKHGDELVSAIQQKLIRGITVVPATGGYTKENLEMLVMVLTRYELYYLEKIIKEVDENAFVNIVQTTKVYGFFRKDFE
ncbi:YitT family protein [Massilibacterium senegalense]|uniref:YitT family protein n=1 Tax=Massilibacterium senegalense TaxID=1632858 RepID=UPI00078088CE|nr:YitT family protein [Massilibacterium senegalense]